MRRSWRALRELDQTPIYHGAMIPSRPKAPLRLQILYQEAMAHFMPPSSRLRFVNLAILHLL